MTEPTDPAGRRLSPDGFWAWDGAAWVPATGDATDPTGRPLSPDGRHVWTGTAWAPAAGEAGPGTEPAGLDDAPGGGTGPAADAAETTSPDAPASDGPAPAGPAAADPSTTAPLPPAGATAPLPPADVTASADGTGPADETAPAVDTGPEGATAATEPTPAEATAPLPPAGTAPAPVVPEPAAGPAPTAILPPVVPDTRPRSEDGQWAWNGSSWEPANQPPQAAAGVPLPAWGLGQPEQPRRRTGLYVVIAVVVLLVLGGAGTGIYFATRSSGGGSSVTADSTSPTSSSPTDTDSPSTSASTFSDDTVASPTDTSDPYGDVTPPPSEKAAPLGDRFEVTGRDAGTKADVSLTKVVDPATETLSSDPPPAGYRYVAYAFTIKNVGTTTLRQTVTDDVVVFVDGGKSLTPDFTIGTTSGPSIDDISVAPRKSTSGYVVVAMPTSVKTSTVLFALDAGDGQAGYWKAS